jgi:GntR family transcriptional regulator, arabinose operon transcriptional repressor
MLDLKLPATSDAPIYSQIVDAVCEAISAKQIEPGAKLPSEPALAAKIQVSRMTVSRAYEQLQNRGVIQQRRGSGSYVSSDALGKMQGAVGRQVQNLAIILGETSLARCARQTLFIKTALLEGIGEVLGEREHHWTFHESLDQQVADGLTENDAVIILGHQTLDLSAVLNLQKRGIRLVSLMDIPGLYTIPSVLYDSLHSAALACSHLIECGYKRIGYLGRKTYARPKFGGSIKFMAFIDALHGAGIDFSGRHIRHVPSTPGKAYAAARDMADKGDLPDAFFVDTDYKAMETIAALNDAGVRVPEDVGICSYDDIPEAATFQPALTSVRVPRRELGRRAARMLLGWPTDGTVPENIVLQSKLIVRASTVSRAAEEMKQP